MIAPSKSSSLRHRSAARTLAVLVSIAFAACATGEAAVDGDDGEGASGSSAGPGGSSAAAGQGASAGGASAGGPSAGGASAGGSSAQTGGAAGKTSGAGAGGGSQAGTSSAGGASAGHAGTTASGGSPAGAGGHGATGGSPTGAGGNAAGHGGAVTSVGGMGTAGTMAAAGMGTAGTMAAAGMATAGTSSVGGMASAGMSSAGGMATAGMTSAGGAGAGGSPTANACATANEGSTAKISCPAGTAITSVVVASYGTPSGTCGAFVVDPTCDEGGVSALVGSACIGGTTCSIDVSNDSLGGDPCKGTTKHFDVEVTCGPCGSVPGSEVCGTSCVNTNSDPNHCGSCKKECDPNTDACQGGSCTCDPTACDNYCFDECDGFGDCEGSDCSCTDCF